MRSRADGFTLIEVLVALAILSLTLLAVLQAFGSGLEQERRAAASTARLLEARSLLDEAGTAFPLAEREGYLASGEQWRLEAAPIDEDGVASSPVRAYRLDLTVTDGARTVLTLSTVRLGP